MKEFWWHWPSLGEEPMRSDMQWEDDVLGWAENSVVQQHYEKRAAFEHEGWLVWILYDPKGDQFGCWVFRP